MGVRYSGKPIVYSTSIRSDTSAHMRADLDAVLSSVAIARASATGGFKYTLQSPDGLQMKIWVQDLGDGSGAFLRITPTSADEGRTGTLGLIGFGAPVPYEVWANCCQFFIAQLGVADTFNNFACGVLALPSGSGPCNTNAAAPTVTELWWSSAAVDANGVTQNFRMCRYDSANWALSYNGALVSTAGQVLNMMPLCSTLNVDYAYGSPAAIARYTSGTGLRIDPLISVGQQIYGQLWDAHFYTLPATLDSVATLTDTDAAGQTVTSSWLAWNNEVPSPPTAGVGTVLGTLFLLLSSFTESLVNVAY